VAGFEAAASVAVITLDGVVIDMDTVATGVVVIGVDVEASILTASDLDVLLACGVQSTAVDLDIGGHIGEDTVLVNAMPSASVSSSFRLCSSRMLTKL